MQFYRISKTTFYKLILFHSTEEEKKQVIQEERDKMKAFADLQDAVRRLDNRISVMLGRSPRSPRDAAEETLLRPGETGGDLYERIKASPPRVAADL